MSLVGVTLLGATLLIDDDTDTDAPTDPQEPDTVVNGTEGNDMLTAQAGENVNGLGGDDSITGGDVSEFVAEPLDGATLNGGVGNDTIDAFAENAILRCGEGDDMLSALGSGSIYGNDGDDSFTNLALVDDNSFSIFGGDGNDTVDYAETTGQIRGG